MPTIVISECVLVYLHESSVTDVRRDLRNFFSNFVMVDYEMLNPSDAFGSMMVKNFQVA